MNNIENLKDLIIYQSQNNVNISVEVLYNEEDFWLTQKSMSKLFNVAENNITYHLQNIFKTAELEENRTTQKIRVVQNEGARKVSREVTFYSLDAIIAVGYRVNSKEATDFRIWATKILKEYMKLEYHINLEKYDDTACMIYDLEYQPVFAGGSGPACMPLVVYSYILERMRRKIYLLIVLVFSLFYSCTTSTLNPSDYYLFMKGYNNVEQFSNKIAKLNGNSFFFGELGAIYSIWSYSSFNNVNFIVIYKYKGKDMVTYQVYKYNNDINWLKQFNEPEVSNVIFRNFAVLDGGAFYYNYIDNNQPQIPS